MEKYKIEDFTEKISEHISFINFEELIKTVISDNNDFTFKFDKFSEMNSYLEKLFKDNFDLLEENNYEVIKEIGDFEITYIMKSNLKISEEVFEDSYLISLQLKNKKGEIYHEQYNEMSLSDFEIMYGSITDEIVSLNVIKIGENI